MADDGFPAASSTRARRGRSVAAATQKTLGSNIDDFLGGGSSPAPTPVSEPTKGMPEPGGWVSDKSGVENYELPQREQKPTNHPFEHWPLNGLVCEICGEPQRKTPSGATCANAGHGGVNGVLISEFKALKQEQSFKSDIESKKTDSMFGPFPSVDSVVSRPNNPTTQSNALDDSLAAPRQTKSPDLPPAYGRIVRTLFAFDPDKVFDELEAAMRLPKPMRDMGYLELSEYLDQASRHHVNASKLHADAKVKLALFEADCLAISGDMRKQASVQLKAEKDEAKGGKMITESDIEARIAQIFPDEFRRQTKLRNEMKATVGHFETYVRSWELRRRELDTMLRECRK